MSAVRELSDRIAGLTIAEAVELRTLLKERYGIEPAAAGTVGRPLPEPSPVPPTPPAAAAFDVVLDGADPAKRIHVIRVVRELTGQGLAEAKATVEGAPKAIRQGVDRKTAGEIGKTLEEAGGRVSVRPSPD